MTGPAYLMHIIYAPHHRLVGRPSLVELDQILKDQVSPGISTPLHKQAAF